MQFAAPPRVSPSPTKRQAVSRTRVTVGEGRGEGERAGCLGQIWSFVGDGNESGVSGDGFPLIRPSGTFSPRGEKDPMQACVTKGVRTLFKRVARW